MPITDTTTTQTVQDIVSPLGHYNYQLTWALDATTLLPVGVKHEIIYPPTVNPGE